MLRERVGPSLRRGGFTGSGRTWRATNSLGDVAVVSVQSSAFNSSDSLRCVINVALAPRPWREWMTAWTGTSPKTVTYTAGLFRDRLHPAGTAAGVDGWWHITGSADAEPAAHDMIAQLESEGLPLLHDLLDRGRLLDTIRSGDLGFIEKRSSPAYFVSAEAVLLADYGSSTELDQVLELARSCTATSQQQDAHEFEAWARQQAARAPASSGTT